MGQPSQLSINKDGEDSKYDQIFTIKKKKELNRETMERDMTTILVKNA